MSGSLFLNGSQPSDLKESFLFSAFRRLKRGSRSMSTTDIIVSSAGEGPQGAGQVMGHDETAKNRRSLVQHSGDLSQAPPLLKQAQQLPQSHDHNLLRPTYDQASDRLHGTPDSGYHSEHKSQTPTRQEQLPRPPSTSPLGTGTMPAPALAPTVSLSFSSSQQRARHERRAASTSAAVMGSSPLVADESQERPKMPMGGTLSRHTLQRTRTTDMLLSPTLTLARPSSVVLPPLPPITLNSPSVRSPIYTPLTLILTQNVLL